MKCHQGALQCPVCDKTFQRQIALEEHMAIHFKQVPAEFESLQWELES